MHKRPPYVPWSTRVVVREPGIKEREGLVTDLKYSAPRDTWFVGIQDEDGMVRSVAAEYVAGSFPR